MAGSQVTITPLVTFTILSDERSRSSFLAALLRGGGRVVGRVGRDEVEEDDEEEEQDAQEVGGQGELDVAHHLASESPGNSTSWEVVIKQNVNSEMRNKSLEESVLN